MIVPVKTANFLAKYSCPKWNRGNPNNKTSILIHKILRRLCRYSLWSLALADNKLAPIIHRKIWFELNPSGINNTYPILFRHINIPEDNDSLVVDPANFVIKYAPSYCAYMIYRVTGKWPTKNVKARDDAHATEIAQRERPRDAKYWLEFLQAQDCYGGIVSRPCNGSYYIGINPNYGEYGLVVWFEVAMYEIDSEPTEVWVSSYIDHKFYGAKVPISDFTWVKIDCKSRP